MDRDWKSEAMRRFGRWWGLIAALSLVFSLLWYAGTVSGAEFIYTPYLSNTRPDGVTIIWVTKEKGIGKVAYGETETYGSIVEPMEVDSCLKYRVGEIFANKVRIHGLVPGKIYHYKVFGDGLPEEKGTFKTAPPPGTPLSFICHGDWYFASDEDVAFAEKALGHPIDLAVHVGDHAIKNGFKDWQRRIPNFIARGNHDNEGKDPQELQHYYDFDNDELTFSLEWGLAHFLFMDTPGYSRPFRKEHLELIEKDLSESRARWKFYVCHHVLFSDSSHGNKRFRTDGRDQLEFEGMLRRKQAWPIFIKYGLDMALTGHDHIYQRSYPVTADGERDDNEGVPCAVVGGGSYGFYYLSNWCAEAWNRRMGPVTIEIHADQMTMTFFSRPHKDAETYQIIDYYVRSKDPGYAGRMLEALKYPDPEKRLKAIRELGGLCEERAAEPLLDMLKTAQGSEKKEMALALQRIGHTATMSRFAEYLEDPDIQDNVLHALGRRGTADDLARCYAIYHGIKDNQWKRTKVVEGATRVGDERAIAFLLSITPQAPEVDAYDCFLKKIMMFYERSKITQALPLVAKRLLDDYEGTGLFAAKKSRARPVAWDFILKGNWPPEEGKRWLTRLLEKEPDPKRKAAIREALERIASNTPAASSKP